jgi:uncharacterized protein
LSEETWEHLRSYLELKGPGLLAFSGGADSSLLLTALVKAGQSVSAATFASPLHPRHELERARVLTDRLGVEHLIVEEDPLTDATFAVNPPDRCYLCKKRRLSQLSELARERSLSTLLEGTLSSDEKAHRPGLKASAEAGTIAPLAEAGFSKKDVWTLGRWLGLEDWLKPASSCLATRVEYGQKLTNELLFNIAKAENLICQITGLEAGAVRLRVHGRLARIEVDPDRFTALIDPTGRSKVLKVLPKLGFTYFTLDLNGFHSGSMDRSLLNS